MTPCLLVGGPAHGRVVNLRRGQGEHYEYDVSLKYPDVPPGSEIPAPAGGIVIVRYVRHWFEHDGKFYAVGVPHTDDPDTVRRGYILDAIARHHLQPSIP